MRPRFADTRQATKDDLISILCSLATNMSADNAGRWSVSTVRAAIAAAIEAVITERAGLIADRDDFERRWLAECREHGETRRKLDAARLELERAVAAACCDDPTPGTDDSGKPYCESCDSDL